MNPLAFDHAKESLEDAEDACSALTSAKDYPSVRKAWRHFLYAADTIYEKLRWGSKGFGRSEAWYGRKVNERNKDELLRYVHQAINSSHHGLVEITQFVGERKILKAPPGWPEGSFIMTVGEGEVSFGNDEVGYVPLELRSQQPLVILTEVVNDKYKHVCPPPRHHLRFTDGGTLPWHLDQGAEVIGAAINALEYLRELVEEARNYVQAQPAP